MVSGMYIGEVVRNVLLQLIDHGHLFDGHSSNNLNRHYGLDTALMSALEGLPATVYSSAPPTSSDWKASIAETRKVLTQNLMIKDKYITDSDCLLVRRVSEIVGTRGARLAAVAVAATLIQTGYDQKDNSTGTLPEFSIGVDGSLVELYPHFEFRLRQALRDIVGSEVEKKVRLGLAKDGSGVGGESQRQLFTFYLPIHTCETDYNNCVSMQPLSLHCQLTSKLMPSQMLPLRRSRPNFYTESQKERGSKKHHQPNSPKTACLNRIWMPDTNNCTKVYLLVPFCTSS